MRLAGRANWWAPAPLKRVYERIGLSEGRAEEALLDLRAPIPPSNGDRAPKEPVTPERIGGSGGST
jgi:RND superfamily putative drug exporter